MENNYCVYMHIAPSGKKYIGITSQRPTHRFSNGNGYKQHRYFYSAICKYGWDNIEHIILDKNLSKDEACEREKFYISKYKSTDRRYGYNISTGGDSGASGTSWTEERRKNHVPQNKRPIDKYSLEGKYLKTYDSIASASNDCHIGQSGIIACLKGERLKAGGYIWRYRGDCFSNGKTESNKYRKVKMYSLGGDLIKTYDSIYNASIDNGINKSHIGECCRGKAKSVEGYVFRYERDSFDKYDTKNRNGEAQSIKVEQYSLDGVFIKVFDSITEAAESVCGFKTNISAVCRNKRKSCYGYIWKYAEVV